MFLLLLSVLLLVLLPVVSYSEAEHPISETDLTRLQQIFNQISAQADQLQLQNQQLTSQLAASKKNMTLLLANMATYKQNMTDYQSKQQEYQTELAQVKELSAQARELSEQSQALAEKVQTSFNEYKKQVESTIKRLVWERNASFIAAIVILIFK